MPRKEAPQTGNSEFSKNPQPKPRRYSFVSPGRSAANAARWNTQWRDTMIEKLKKQTDVPEKSKPAFIAHNERLKKSGRPDLEKRRESEAKGGPMLKAIPFLLRGMLGDDIVRITGIGERQIVNLQHNLRNQERNSLYRLPKPSLEEIRLTRRKTKERRLNGLTKEDTQRLLLIRRFWEEGFIGEDLSIWNQLHEMYQQTGRALPDDLGDHIILEMYLKALRAHIGGEDQIERAWREIEKAADHDTLRPLRQEKLFVKIKLVSPWADWENRHGLYTVTEAGRQYRPVLLEGRVARETSNLALKRARMRGGLSGGK